MSLSPNSPWVVDSIRRRELPKGAPTFARDFKMINLGIVDCPQTIANAINSRGDVAGFFLTSLKPISRRALVYSNGTMSSLNDLNDPMSGRDLIWANAINDNGWIAACGVNPHSERNAVLLIPIPEPSTLLLLGTGAIGLLPYAWQRYMHKAKELLESVIRTQPCERVGYTLVSEFQSYSGNLD
jgi:hypothetical protein